MQFATSTFAAAALAVVSFSCASDVGPPSGSPAALERRALAGPSTPAATSEPKADELEEPVQEAVHLASLVPGGSFAWVQVESLDALERVGDEILSMAAAERDSMTVSDLLELFPVEGVVEYLDTSRPLGLAIGFAEGTTTPGSTIVLPTHDRDALVSGLRGMPGKPLVFGIDDYVVATTLPEYEPGVGAPALTEGLPAGELVARFDVPAFVGATGEMVELALWQLKTEAGEQAHVGWFEALAEAVSAAASLDVAFELIDGELDLSLALRASEGSVLDGLLPTGSSDLRDLAHLVGDDDSIALLMSVDTETTQSLISLWTGATEAAGVAEGHYDAASSWLAEFSELWPLMGDAVVVTGAAATGGLQLSYFFEPTDHEAFKERLTAALSALDEMAPGLRVEGPETRQDGATRFWFSAQEAAEARHGRAAALVDVLERVDGANPAFVAQVDFVALTRDFLSMFRNPVDTDLDLRVPAGARPLPVTYYGGVDGLEWRLGFRTDFSRFGDLLRQARAGAQ